MLGRILKGVGGFFHIYVEEKNNYYKNIIVCNSRGIFRKDKIKPCVGDIVEIEINEENRDENETTGLITNISERKNILLRPPISNIDKIFIIIATKMPAPSFYFIDKLTVTAIDNNIAPIIIINKTDLDDGDEIYNIYKKTPFKIYKTSDKSDNYSEIKVEMENSVSAFAGASGVGKSSLVKILTGINILETDILSSRTERGRHTTKTVEIFPLGDKTYIADTPGFSILDFEKTIYIRKENLILSFPDLLKYSSECKYTKCTHTKEDGCNIIKAVKNGNLSESRHESYNELVKEIKTQRTWEIDKKLNINEKNL